MTPEGRQELDAVITEMRSTWEFNQHVGHVVSHERVWEWADRLALLLADVSPMTPEARPELRTLIAKWRAEEAEHKQLAAGHAPMGGSLYVHHMALWKTTKAHADELEASLSLDQQHERTRDEDDRDEGPSERSIREYLAQLAQKEEDSRTASENETTPATVTPNKIHNEVANLKAERAGLQRRIVELGRQAVERQALISRLEVALASRTSLVVGACRTCEDVMRAVPYCPRCGPHSWYGPCDGLGDDGGCSECERAAALLGKGDG